MTRHPAIAVGDQPRNVASADFNKDGLLDLVVTNHLDRDISLLYGQVAGGFGGRRDYGVGGYALGIVTEDFNSDTWPDVAVTNWTAGSITVCYGQTDGSLGGCVDYAVGSARPAVVVSADFDLDGLLDLAVTNTEAGSVTILYGQPGGGFDRRRDISVGSQPAYGLATDDFNKDGRPDLVVAKTGEDKVRLLYGDANGDFALQREYAVGDQPGEYMVTADFNRDGWLDMAVTTLAGVSVLYGESGGLGSRHDLTVGNIPRGIAAADLNRNGWDDLIVANDADDDVSVLYNVAAEPGLGGWTIYLDSNGNGQLDEGEASTFTMADNPQTAQVDETGMYWFRDLLPGTYRVTEEPKGGWHQTSPDIKLVYHAGNPGPMYVRNGLAGADVPFLHADAPAVRVPHWSADGSMILFQMGGHLYVARSDGSERRVIADGSDGTFSPDATRIVYASAGGDLYTVGVSPGSSPSPLVDSQDRPVNGAIPRWSPDGTTILFSDWHGVLPANLFLYDMQARTVRPLTSAVSGQAFVHSAWSPDGSRIVAGAVQPGTGKEDIWVMNAADGSDAINLTADWATTREWYPSWSSDGQWIVFASDHSGNSDVWRMRPDGSSRMPVTDTPGVSETYPWVVGGVHLVTVRAGDVVGGVDFGNQQNRPPLVRNPIPDLEVAEDSPDSIVNLSDTFGDLDIAGCGDRLTLTVADNTRGDLFSSVSLAGTALTLEYAADQNGMARITVRATDLGGLWVEESFDVRVAAVNDAPTLSWSTYLGGPGSSQEPGLEQSSAVAIDASGNIFAVGKTWSSGWITGGLGGFGSTYNGGGDAFVAKLSPSGALLWSLYLGGAGEDMGYGIAVDAAGNAFVTGNTLSEGWVSGGYDPTYNGEMDAFVVKLSPDGAHLWSTYVGGSAQEEGQRIAVDRSGNAVMTGGTHSSDFVSGGFDTTRNAWVDAYVVKVSGGGEHLWSTYLPAEDGNGGAGIAVDPSDNILVVGREGDRGWTMKVRADGQGYEWHQYLGGTLGAIGVAADGAEHVLVSGGGGASPYDAFVTKLNSADGTVEWLTYDARQ